MKKLFYLFVMIAGMTVASVNVNAQEATSKPKAATCCKAGDKKACCKSGDKASAAKCTKKTTADATVKKDASTTPTKN